MNELPLVTVLSDGYRPQNFEQKNQTWTYVQVIISLVRSFCISRREGNMSRSQSNRVLQDQSASFEKKEVGMCGQF